jgi:hypothetical protein
VSANVPAWWPSLLEPPDQAEVSRMRGEGQMDKLHRHLGASALALTVLALAAVPLNAQEILMPAGPEKGVWVEMSHPSFEDAGPQVTTASSLWYLGARYAVTPRFRAIVDVPFSYAKFSDVPGTEGGSALGNPYLGAEFVAVPQLVFDLGARLPFHRHKEKADAACLVAMMSDPMRAEAFAEDWVPVSGGMSYAQTAPSGIGVRARAGATGLFYTGSETGVDPELWVDYGAFGTYPVSIARFGLGVSGRWFASEEEGDFAENSLHQLGLTADVAVAGVRPGVALRLPLDEDWRREYRMSLGLYLQVPLR